MKTKLIFTIIGIIHVFIGGSLLAGVLFDPRGMLEPYFTGELTDETIQLFAGTADVVGSFNIGIGAMLLIIRIISDLESAKRVLLGQSVLVGFGLLIALYNHLYMGGGPPIPILVLLFISAFFALYGSRAGTL